MNQSGIKVSDSLVGKISTITDSLRALKISIIDEVLQSNDEQASSGSFEQDFDLLTELVREDEAAYILVRRDDGTFVFVSYVGDGAKVKDKMVYASTRNTLSRELGSKLSSSYFATTKGELTYSAFSKQQRSDTADKPLSTKEKELRDVKDAEGETVHNTQTKSAIVSSGVSFPISEAAQEALNVLQTTSVSRVVSLSIDTKTEVIELEASKELDLDDLASVVPDDSPRYTFFSWVHQVEHAGVTTQCFIYTCPSIANVRERMLYSSNRQSIITSSGLTIDHKYEAEELDLADLKTRLVPPKETKSAGFSRPKRPGKK